MLLASRSIDALERVRAPLIDPDRADVLSLDYLTPASVENALASAEHIDHVVIPAVADENKKRGAFLSLDAATMQASFAKLWGQINVLRAAFPKMPAGGSPTLFKSIAGLKPTGRDSGLSVMNAVQAAVIQLGRSFAIEMAPIRVNVIAPGVVLTNVWNKTEQADLVRWMQETLPVRRAGTAEDLAQAAFSLMTNRYITGGRPRRGWRPSSCLKQLRP